MLTLKGDSQRFQLASVKETQYPAGEFDVVTFGVVLEYLYDPAEAIEKAMGQIKK